MPLAEKIKVMIYGREFEIDAMGLSPLEASALAQYVTDKMKEIEDQTGRVDTAKLAVIAALNITDELFRARQNHTYVDDSIDKRAQALLCQIDAALSAHELLPDTAVS